MDVCVGDKVKLLNIQGGGVVKAVLSSGNIVVTEDTGFDSEFLLSEIIVIKQDDSHHYKVDEVVINQKIKNKITPKKKASSSILDKYVRTPKYQYESVVEVDLHLEKLVEFPNRLEDWQKLHKQMQHFKNCLETAIDKNIKRIVFVHGVGQGILKTEILNYMANYPHYRVKDADMLEYGRGATEIVLR